METKHAAKSKVNWAGMAIIAVSLLPHVSDVAASVLPPDKATIVTGILGALVMVLRTFFTSEPVRL